MKKIFVLMILAIFVIGMVPMAFAESGNGKAKPTLLEKGPKDDAKAKPIVKLRTKVLKIKKDIAKEKLLEAKKRLELAKEKFKNARERYSNGKEKFKEAKDKLADCEGEECDELKAKALEHAKEWVANSGKMAIEHLEKLKERIEGNEFYDEEAVEERLASLEEKISEIEALVEKAELAETKEDLRAVAREIASIWKGFKNQAKHYGNKLINNQLRGLIYSAERLEKVFECVKAEMEAEGADSEMVSDLLAKLDAKGDEAKEAYERAEELLDMAKEAREGKDLDSFKEYSAEAKTKMTEAKKAIRDAYILVKELSKETSGNAHLMSCRAAVAEGQVEVEEEEAETGEEDESNTEADDSEEDTEADDTEDESDTEADDTTEDSEDDTETQGDNESTEGLNTE